MHLIDTNDRPRDLTVRTSMKCRVPGVCALVVALLLCKAIAEGFHPTTHKCKSNQTHLGPYKMETPKTRTSSYSHHMTHHSLIEHGWSLECQGKPHPELRPFIRSITTTTGHHHVTSLEDHGITSINHTFKFDTQLMIFDVHILVHDHSLTSNIEVYFPNASLTCSNVSVTM